MQRSLVLVAAVVFGCSSGPDQDSAPAVVGPADTSPGPILTLSANHSAAPQAHPGWPILLKLGIQADEGLTVALASVGPLWIDGLRFEVTGANGATVTWPLETLRTTDDGPTLALGVNDVAMVYAWVTPADSEALTPGEYTLRAVFDATGAPPSAWQGVATSSLVRLTLVPAGQALSVASDQDATSELASDKMLRAALFTLQGDTTAAKTEVSALVAAEPTHAGALAYLGDLQALDGELDLAIDSYAQAVRAALADSTAVGEVPTLLMSRHADLVARRIQATGDFEAPRVTVAVGGHGAEATPGLEYVDLTFKNEGAGYAVGARLQAVSARVLEGNGAIVLVPPLPPAAARSVGGLAPGGTATVRVTLRPDPGVVRFELTEIVIVRDLVGGTVDLMVSQEVVR